MNDQQNYRLAELEIHPGVSIIIPAFNSGSTIEQTLNSLLAQKNEDWEAIVVDDGSSDDTLEIVSRFARTDIRIRLVQQSNAGASAARNAGIRSARFGWLLFLDSDDWISADYLVVMMEALHKQAADAMVCGWWRVHPSGEIQEENFAGIDAELFHSFTQRCVFAIHSCVVKKQLVIDAGGFDEQLKTCEDWDLWLRLVRMGVVFKEVKRVMAYYRMSELSLSNDVNQLFQDGLTVLRRAHQPDVRHANFQQEYREGGTEWDYQAAAVQWICWIFGMTLHSETDTTYIHEALKGFSSSDLDTVRIANSIFYAAVLPRCERLADWYLQWNSSESRLRVFLTHLEKCNCVPTLSRRTMLVLERLVLRFAPSSGNHVIGSTYGVVIDVCKAINDIVCSSEIERLSISLKMGTVHVGDFELPVINHVVTGWVLNDAIAAQFAWPLLGHYFSHSIYRETSIGKQASDEEIQQYHDEHGWTAFLREVWGLNSIDGNRFYDPAPLSDDVNNMDLDSPYFLLEICRPVPNIKTSLSLITIVYSLGGSVIGHLNMFPKQGIITAQSLRAAITTHAGYELCRVFVRETLIGNPVGEAASLRQRMMQKAASNAEIVVQGREGEFTLLPEEPVLSNYSVLTRTFNLVGTAASRRVVFPQEANSVLREMAVTTNEALLQSSAVYESAIVYYPGLLASVVEEIPRTEGDLVANHSDYDRHHFETLFSTSPDPWKYTSPYEETKYQLTLSLIPDGKIQTALEIACAEGHFTEKLAAKVNKLVAADISTVALERAAARCSEFENISYRQIDLTRDELPGKHDLVVCSEVLYYVGDRSQLKNVASKIASALTDDGHLVMAHAHLVIDEPKKPGFDWGLPFGAKVIGETFASLPTLQLVKEIRTPLYRVQLFKKTKKSFFSWKKNGAAQVIEIEQPTEVPEDVADTVRWNGALQPVILSPQEVTTSALPILMYHRVAPTGSKRMSRYRIAPRAFEEQLKYLRDSGYHTISWQEWLSAMLYKKPVAGRAIALTFDDAYLDFYEFALPLLKQYSFDASVFAVSEFVGKSNEWDQAFGEKLELMNWEQLKNLQNEGFEIGSHTASHQPLTGLKATEVVAELAMSRSMITNSIGSGVNSIAYPHGDVDEAVAHLTGGVGYTVGLTCKPGFCRFTDNPLLMPRIEITGYDHLNHFVAKLG